MIPIKLMYCIDGPLTGHTAVVKEGAFETEVTVCDQGMTAQVFTYHVRLAGLRQWPLVKLTEFLTVSDGQPGDDVLQGLVDKTHWEMDVMPSFLYDFPRWWTWVRTKLWLEEEFPLTADQDDFELQFFEFKLRNHL
jgi:hypothetical protein